MVNGGGEMKIILLAGIFVLAASSAWAQDPGMDAAMQASQAAIQANMQASQQAMADMQQAMQNANDTTNYGPVIAITQLPKFSVKAGNVAAGTLVRMQSRTHKATIYYTTNGWSPTVHSRRYIGPVKIDKDTMLQAIAVAPNMNPSLIMQAQFKVSGSAQNEPATLATSGVLRAGTRLELTTAADASSKTAQVGDSLPLKLNQDVTVGSQVVISKGTVVEGLITQADSAGHIGAPGDISFEVHALTAQGVTVPLRGGETLDGDNRMQRRAGLVLIPIVGPIAMLASKGGEAVIKPGMTFSVVVAADTPLSAAAAAPVPVPAG